MARDLRGFIKLLEEKGQLKRISAPVDPDLEIAEIANRMLQKGGPGLLFENVKGASFPVAVNLLGTVERICWAMNMQHPLELEELGKKLAMLQQPKPPKKIAQAVEFGKVLFDVLKAKPGRDFFPACQQVVIQGDELDLNKLPLIRPYSGDAGKIITLGLVITKNCETGTPNVGVYRLQLQSKNTMTVHWLSVRGGARHLRKAAERGKKLEIAIALGVDPLIIMAAATPIPVDLSEWLFAGLYGGSGVQLAKCKTVDLEVPAEIVDFFLPMEALSYKAAIISIDKAYPGQARRAALAFWSALPQFTYTKFVIVVDKTINIRDPRQVVWAISSKVDPSRDVFILPNTPFDTLDFASEKIGLGGRMGIDATTKIPPETEHEWGDSLESDPETAAMVDRRWAEYGLAELQLGEVDPNLFGYDFKQ
ncbi:UbiD family decarboxylase [Scytonema sp. NUACC26]|uniref:UbiD family decarboxylase n=1 Tax=Scytonema sp. NUACC26 TaxID=3140176 RepID=UPI0034DBAAF7